MHFTRRNALAFPLALSIPIVEAKAQAFPDRPVRIVVPFGAGGTLSVIARVLGNELTNKWGQQFLVDNRAGAGGNVGAEIIAKAKPDGYSLMFTTQTLAVNATLTPSKIFDAQKSFDPIIHALSGENVLITSQLLDVKTLDQLIRHAKANPDTLNFASLGNGSTSFLATELFKSLTGITANHIPYNGVSQATTDIIAGRVSFWITTLGGALPQIQGGLVRALAISGNRRSKSLPDVPTFAEAGYPDFKASAWFGFFAPIGTDPAIIQKLNNDFNSVLSDPAVVERLQGAHVEVVGGTPESMRTFLNEEIERWADVIKKTGLAPK